MNIGGNKLDKRLTITIEQAGVRLGLSRTTAYMLAHQGVIPVLRLGRQLKVPLVQFEKLLNGKAISIENKMDKEK
jgi:excisionase family DNA binding protein